MLARSGLEFVVIIKSPQMLAYMSSRFKGGTSEIGQKVCQAFSICYRIEEKPTFCKCISASKQEKSAMPT